MNNNAGIVRDVVQVEQAKTVTGPYQSPSGAAPIMEGFIEGLSNFAKKSGSGSSKDFGPLNDMVNELSNDIASKGIEGSELETAVKGTISKATHHSQKYNYSDIENAFKTNGMEAYINLIKVKNDQYEIDKTREITNDYWAGRALKGSGKTADEYYTVGAEATSLSNATEEFISKASGLTPQQVQEYFKEGKSSSQIVEADIRNRYLVARSNPRYSYLPSIQVLEASYTSSVNDLISKGLDPLTAQAIADRALVADRVMLMGPEALKKMGAVELEKAARDQQETYLKTATDNVLIEFSNMYFTNPANPKGPKIKGSLVLQEIASKAEGGDISKLSLMSALASLKGTGFYDEFVKQYNDRHSYETLGWTIDNGADMIPVTSKDPTQSRNHGNMNVEALEETAKDIKSKNYSELTDSDTYFQTPKNFIKQHKLSSGRYITPEEVDALYPNTLEREEIVDSIFSSIADGSNAATNDEGFYYIDSNGQLKYLTPYVHADLSKKSGMSVGLLDSTMEGTLIETGDSDAVRMRDNRGVIKETFDILTGSFGYDKEELRNRFNEAQVRGTHGAQKTRAYQLKGAYFTMPMTEEDITEVLKLAENYDKQTAEEIVTGAVGEIWEGTKTAAKLGAKAVAEVGQGVLDAAELTGRASVALSPIGQADLIGMGLGAAGASLEYQKDNRLKAQELAVERYLGQPLKDIVPYADEITENTDGSLRVRHSYTEGPDPAVKAPSEGTASYVDEENTMYFTDTNGNTISFKGITPIKGVTVPEAVKSGDLLAAPQEIMTVTSDKPLLSDESRELVRKRTPQPQPLPPNRSETSEQFSVQQVKGSYEAPAQVAPFEYSGNIDLDNRPVVVNEDGSISTERSIVIEEDGEYIIIPTVINGKIVSDDEAIQHYHETGENHGKYKNVTEAVRKSEEISREQAKRYLNR